MGYVMSDAYQCLSSLRAMLQQRREDIKEKMARGLEQELSFREQTGRTKELAWAIERINEQIKSINGGSEDEK
jgi:hypothetical protein